MSGRMDLWRPQRARGRRYFAPIYFLSSSSSSKPLQTLPQLCPISLLVRFQFKSFRVIDLRYVSPPIPNLFFANPCSMCLALPCLGYAYFDLNFEFGLDSLMFLEEYDVVIAVRSILFHSIGLKNYFVDVYKEVHTCRSR